MVWTLVRVHLTDLLNHLSELVLCLDSFKNVLKK